MQLYLISCNFNFRNRWNDNQSNYKLIVKIWFVVEKELFFIMVPLRISIICMWYSWPCQSFRRLEGLFVPFNLSFTVERRSRSGQAIEYAIGQANGQAGWNHRWPPLQIEFIESQEQPLKLEERNNWSINAYREKWSISKFLFEFNRWKTLKRFLSWNQPTT